jgi:hypothetical protein
MLFTTGIASIHLVNVSMVMNKNLNPSGALGKTPMISIPQIVKGQTGENFPSGFEAEPLTNRRP